MIKTQFEKSMPPPRTNMSVRSAVSGEDRRVWSTERCQVPSTSCVTASRASITGIRNVMCKYIIHHATMLGCVALFSVGGCSDNGNTDDRRLKQRVKTQVITLKCSGEDKSIDPTHVDLGPKIEKSEFYLQVDQHNSKLGNWNNDKRSFETEVQKGAKCDITIDNTSITQYCAVKNIYEDATAQRINTMRIDRNTGSYSSTFTWKIYRNNGRVVPMFEARSLGVCSSYEGSPPVNKF